MLRRLRIRDFAIVEDLSLEFGAGLNVLTGETGAGKSILVDAVGLAVGARADRAMVRSGCEVARVEALFELPPESPATRLAAARGVLDPGGTEVLVRREVALEGPNRTLINGSPATQALLQELGGWLLELHGQHEQQRLFDPRIQLELLDRFAGCDAELAAVERAWSRCQESEVALAELQARAAERGARETRLAEELREIDAVRPREGELETLDAERLRLRNAGGIARLLDETVEALYEGEPGAAELAAGAAARARRLAELDPALGEVARRLESAALELADAGAALRDHRERASFDPARLEALETRRVALERLRARYGRDEAEVLAHRERAAAELDALGRMARDTAAARDALAAAEQDYAAAATTLGDVRRRAAGRLADAIVVELAELALGGSRVDVRFTPAAGRPVRGADGSTLALAARGAERAELLLSTNPGEPPRPLARVASGGELSRVMLALHGIFAAALPEAGALVFDEVDAGVGGAVADAVGARLAALGRRHQVLCVTHLAPVARWADRHLAVRKRVAAGRTLVEVGELGPAERVEELARMLGGRVVTAATRASAAELLRQAQPLRRARRRDAAGTPTERP